MVTRSHPGGVEQSRPYRKVRLVWVTHHQPTVTECLETFQAAHDTGLTDLVLQRDNGVESSQLAPDIEGEAGWVEPTEVEVQCAKQRHPEVAGLAYSPGVVVELLARARTEAVRVGYEQAIDPDCLGIAGNSTGLLQRIERSVQQEVLSATGLVDGCFHEPLHLVGSGARLRNEKRFPKSQFDVAADIVMEGVESGTHGRTNQETRTLSWEESGTLRPGEFIELQAVTRVGKSASIDYTGTMVVIMENGKDTFEYPINRPDESSIPTGLCNVTGQGRWADGCGHR